MDLSFPSLAAVDRLLLWLSGCVCTQIGLLCARATLFGLFWSFFQLLSAHSPLASRTGAYSVSPRRSHFNWTSLVFFFLGFPRMSTFGFGIRHLSAFSAREPLKPTFSSLFLALLCAFAAGLQLGLQVGYV